MARPKQRRSIVSAAIAILVSFVVPALLRAAESTVNSPAAASSNFTVTGHITDIGGRVIANATIEWGSDKTPFKNRQHVTTNADGAYQLIIKTPDRENHFAIFAPGFSIQLADLDFSQRHQVRNFVLQTKTSEGRDVSGTVVDEHDAPIAGVRVEAFTPVEGMNSSFSIETGGDYFIGPDRVVTTDAKGRFRIADLPTAEVQLNLESPHRHVNAANYPVKAGQVIRMSGSGQPGVIQGRVVDAATNQPPQFVRDIRIVPRYTTTVLDCTPDGHFQLRKGTLGERYYVYVYAKGYAAAEGQQLAVRPDSSEFQDIKLTRQAALQGKLVDADTGKPIKNAELMYGVAKGHSYVAWNDLPKYTDGYHSLNFVQHVKSNAAGEFWFAEPADGSRGMLIALIPGYQRLILKPADRQIDAATGDLIVRLKRESVFKGVVLKDGKPQPNISVTVTPEPEGEPSPMPEHVTTNAHGEFTYGRLSPGKYRVHCDLYSRITTIGDGETKTMNLGDDLGPIIIHGEAIPGISIRFLPQFPWEYENFEVTADESGEYVLSGLRPGKYRVYMDSWDNGFHAHANQVEIVVERNGQYVDLRF